MTILIYIIAGIIAVNLLCLFSRKQRYNWEDLWFNFVDIYEQVREEGGLKSYARFSLGLLGLPFLLILTLFVAPISTIENMLKKHRRSKRKFEPVQQEDNQLYHQQMGGAGTIFCKDCGYKADIISFLHSFDDDGNMSDGCTGYQCQSCGKFCSLNDSQSAVKPLLCSCGGELSRDKALFCPQCKSKRMRYNMSYIT